jgi:hypothetical protein
MANWKKLVVSGSGISQLNNDAGYATTASFTNSFSTASFNGTNLLADSQNGTLNFASSSAQGLTIAANATNDTLTFGLSAIPNASLANSTISGVSLGGTLAALTGGAGITSTGTYTGAATRTFSVDSASMAPFFTSATYAGVSGDIIISSSGVATIQPNSVTLGTDTTGNYVSALGTGTGVTIGTNSGEGSTPTIAVNYGAGANTAVQGNITAAIVVTSGELTLDVGASSQTLGSNSSWTIGLADTITGPRTFSGAVTMATASVQNDLTVGGNLYVNGTTTQVNTADLYVADKFIVLASGSATAGDGGIIIDRGGDLAGNVAYGFDATTTRWGYQNGLTDTGNAIAIGTNGNSAFAGYVFTEASHASAPTTGEFVKDGSIYTATSGDIFIYS